MAEEKNEEETPKLGVIDSWYDRLSSYLSAKVSAFVAFLFFLIAFGAAIGFYSALYRPAIAPLVVITPAVLGLIAYYNRSFATILFLLLIVSMFFLI